MAGLIAGSPCMAQQRAFGAAQPKQKIAELEKQSRELSQIAEQQKKRADQNLETARQAAYASDIRAAAGLIAMAKFDAAREILIQIPPSRRRWEWGHFMELCGPPAWRIDINPKQPGPYHPLTSISQALAPEMVRLKEDADQEHERRKVRYVSSQASPLIALIGPGGRHGAYLCVMKKEANTDYSALDPEQLVHSRDPRVEFSVWSGSYEGIETARFTQDGSLLLVKASGCATFSPSATADVSISASGESGIESPVHVFPLRESNAEEAADPDPQGPMRTPWQWMRLTELGAETRNAILQLERLNANDEQQGCRYAEHFVRKDGAILVLFNVWDKNWSGEVVEFPSGKLISKFGREVEGGKTLDLEMTDQGGAFNADGSLVVLCPSGHAGSLPSPAGHWEKPTGTAAVFESNSGLHRSTLRLGGRYTYGSHADPVWGFSPDSGQVFQSSMDVASLENIITVCRVQDGMLVERIPRYIRSIAWSPDSSVIYYVRGNGSAIQVAEATTLKKFSAIPGAVRTSAYPDHGAMRTASTADSSRFAIGRLLFAKDPTTPLVWFEDEVKPPLKSWLLDALHGDSPSNLTLADAALLYWVRQCDESPPKIKR